MRDKSLSLKTKDNIRENDIGRKQRDNKDENMCVRAWTILLLF